LSGHEAIVMNAASLAAGSYRLDGETLDVTAGGASRRLELEGTAAWVRRLAPPRWRQGIASASRAAAERSAWIALIVGLCSDPRLRHLTAYPDLVAAENKLRQHAHATLLGIRTPATAAVSDVKQLPIQLGDPVVVKPLGVGHFIGEGGDGMVVWAQSMQRSDPRLAALRGAPFLVQEQIEARQHLRIVTVFDQAWTAGLDAEGLPIDWRRDEQAHHSFEPVARPEIERAALSLAAAMNLGYSSQDWIETVTGAVFVDLNPAGQWLFLPHAVSDAVSAAIANHLSDT
jgi:hypothetical protein